MIISELPNPEQKVFAPHRISAILGALAEEGISSSVALVNSGLAETCLHDASTRVSLKQTDVVFRNALRLSQDPTTAIRAGRRMKVTSYGIYGYALLSSSTMAEAISFSMKRQHVEGAVVSTLFTCDNGEAVYHYEPILCTDPAEDIYRFYMEFALSSHITLLRSLGVCPKFRRAGLTYPKPPHASLYQDALGCRVDFKQLRNELAFDAEFIATPMPMANLAASVESRAMCDQIFAGMRIEQGLTSTIRRTLVRHPGRFPSLESMAQHLSMHPRALRRKLATEEVSYRDLLVEVRQRLAIEYLRRTNMTTEEIAARLGYSDAANFRRAFMSWTGMRTSEFRGAHGSI